VANSEANGKPIASPRQLLVVGVLGVALLTVLIMQFGGATSGSGDAAGKASPGKKTPSPTGQASGPKSFARPAEAAASKPALAPWPKISAEAAAQYDPFVVPEPLARKITEVKQAKEDRKAKSPPPKRDIRAENVAALKAKGITLIVQSKRGAVAMVGNRAVRVGDTLEGHRVVAIDSSGVLLAPADRQESHEVQK
jgi:hypothetical protein